MCRVRVSLSPILDLLMWFLFGIRSKVESFETKQDSPNKSDTPHSQRGGSGNARLPELTYMHG